MSSYGKYMGNIHEVKSGKIFKEKHRSKMSFFQKQATDHYIQNQFYKYIDNEDNRNFFTESTQPFEKRMIFKSEEF